MAIAFGASLGGAVAGGVSTLNLNTLTVSGTDIVILFAIRYNSGTVTATSVNWDDGGGGSPEALTQLGTYQNFNTDGSRVHLWYLANPNTSNSRLIVNSSGSTDHYICAVYYTGVAQTSIFTTASQGDTDPVASADTSDRDGSWHIGTASSANAGLTPGANTTERVEQSNNLGIADSNATVANTVSHTLNWSEGGSKGFITAMMRPPVAAPAGGGAQAGFMNLMGVGN